MASTPFAPKKADNVTELFTNIAMVTVSPMNWSHFISFPIIYLEGSIHTKIVTDHFPPSYLVYLHHLTVFHYFEPQKSGLHLTSRLDAKTGDPDVRSLITQLLKAEPSEWVMLLCLCDEWCTAFLSSSITCPHLLLTAMHTYNVSFPPPLPLCSFPALHC
jgi:hypothetical protein